MIKNLFLILLVLFATNFLALNNDSLKLKRHLLEFNIGAAQSPQFISNNVSIKYSSYSFSKIKTVSLSYGFCINPNTKKPNSLFYIEAGTKYLHLNFTRLLIDREEQFKTSYKKITYDPDNNIVNYNVNSLLVSLCLQYKLLISDHIVISQKLGINIINILDKDKLYRYERNVRSSNVVSDPTSPSGYTIQNYDAHETIEEGLPIPFRNDVMPFYSIGLGYKINKFTPFVSGDLLIFGGKAIFNYQTGFKLQF